MQRSRLQSARSPRFLELYAYRLSATRQLCYTPDSGQEFLAGYPGRYDDYEHRAANDEEQTKHPKIDVDPVLTGVSRSDNCETQKGRGRNIFSTGPNSNEVMIR